MLTATRKTGRLVTIRIGALVSEAELVGFERALQRAVLGVSGPAVFCTDVRSAQVLPEEVASRIVALMRRLNVRLLRTAILLPPLGATVGLQFERIIREAGSPSRRAFRDAHRASHWLAEVLTPDEQAGLSSFLTETELIGATRFSTLPEDQGPIATRKMSLAPPLWSGPPPKSTAPPK